MLRNCWVEILRKEGEFITFDFGSFGIIVSLGRNKKKTIINSYCQKNYRTEFMEFCEVNIQIGDIDMINMKIDYEDFCLINAMTKRISRHKNNGDLKKLTNLLEGIFP